MTANKPSISHDMADRYIPNQVSAVIGTDDREARSKFWIAIYTRPKSELKTAKELTQLGIQTYTPTQNIVRQWSDRQKKITTVVIPMVIFAKINTDEEILTIKKHPLVHRILSMPGEKIPACIPDSQIEQLKFVLGESTVPVNFVTGPFKHLDSVRVIRGPFIGIEGIVYKETTGVTYVIVLIDNVGGAKIEICKTDIELISRK